MNRRQILGSLLLFFAALAVRGIDSAQFITWDEPLWTHRSMRFLVALQGGNWSGTFQTGHPGVTTMWLGSMGIALRAGNSAERWAELQRLAAMPEVTDDPDVLRSLGDWLAAAKLPLAIAQSALIVLIFWLVAKLFHQSVAVGAAFLLVFDPFHIGLSRVLHLDALVASLMTVGLLAALVANSSRENSANRQRYLAFVCLSAWSAALAVLTKSPGGLVVPFCLLALSWNRHPWRPDRTLFRDLGLWLAVYGLTLLVVWPALATQPVATVLKVYGTATGYYDEPDKSTRFFLGQVDQPLGIGFYLLTLILKMTPLSLLGGVLAIHDLRYRRGRAERVILWLCLLGFLLFMSTGGKKFERYLVPIFPLLDILGAWSLTSRAISLPMRRWLLPVLLSAQATAVLLFHPYYLSYSNPLFGGLPVAVRITQIGWGEGLDQAATYLNSRPDSQQRDLVRGVKGLGPLLSGSAIRVNGEGWVAADHIVVYLNDVQVGHAIARTVRNERPEFVGHIGGIDFVWVYANPVRREILDTLTTHRGNTSDPILLPEDSPLLSLPIASLTPLPTNASEAELRQLLSGYSRAWILRYPGEPDTWPNAVKRLTAFGQETGSWSIDLPTERKSDLVNIVSVTMTTVISARSPR